MDFKRSNVMDRERESLQKASSFAEIPQSKILIFAEKTCRALARTSLVWRRNNFVVFSFGSGWWLEPHKFERVSLIFAQFLFLNFGISTMNYVIIFWINLRVNQNLAQTKLRVIQCFKAWQLKRIVPVQIPLSAWLGLEAQPRYQAPAGNR